MNAGPSYMYIIAGVVGVIVLFVLIVNAGSSSTPTPENPTDEDIRDLARRGEKIAAIKCYRQLHGGGLKEAKEAVEAIMEQK